MDSLPSSTEVCIVGAGPSGLACALGLAARQIPFVIVDALEEGHNGSRAVVMQANALEVCSIHVCISYCGSLCTAQALGALHPDLSTEIVAAGVQSKTMTVVDRRERQVFQMRMTELAADTKYAFCLLIPQHSVEKRMRERLQQVGKSVHWRKRVSGVREVAQAAQYEVRFESGEVMTARYVVAADGSKSSLRSAAGIQYLDPLTSKDARPGTEDLSFVVADVVFASPLPTNIPKDAVRIMAGSGGVILTAPILDTSPSAGAAQNLFRLYIGVPDTPPSAPDAPYLQAILDARGPGSQSTQHNVPKIVKVLDSSRYRTRLALADRYFQRTKGGAYILLVGDAAHKHGPAGGQGMNLGICDGCELAEAIYKHRDLVPVGGKEADGDAVKILEEYSARRRAIARGVIDMVDDMTKFENGGAGWGTYLRSIGLWAVFKLPFVNGMIARRLSGLGHAKKT
ncbi:FAD/NAD(P)-binding domain-containing protein [Mycena crocata]|nr:FAD/NAD(P)-binding domain-containing protein [Mycena crocata]